MLSMNVYKPLFVIIVIPKYYKSREMRIISFDVGMKNLAYCLFRIPDSLATSFGGGSMIPSATNLIHHIIIERWDVIDLRFEPVSPDSITLSTEVISAPKRTCVNDCKLAKWMYLPSGTGTSAALYCTKCSDKSKYKVPSREILPIKRKPELIMKKKLSELMDIKAILSTPIKQSGSSSESGNGQSEAATNLKLRKADLIQEITTTLSRDYLEPFDESKYSSYLAGTVPPSKPKKANYTYAHDLDLITYGRNMMKHLDAILYTPMSSVSNAPIDMMIIENQISTLASRMKTLQGMITQYFIMKNIPQIEFISASCKLKLFTDATLDLDPTNPETVCVDASTYADRKKSGIAICRSLGEISRKHNSDYAKWMPVFENHKKKDDLADCFLQGLWRVHSLCAV
jgi:hypothetical protein